jgi:thymidylate kinase
MTKKSHTIILAGLDGSGKTTQSKKLIEYLESNKLNCHYVWLRYPFRLIIPFVIFLRLFNLSAYPLTIEKKKRGIKNLENHRTLSKIWKNILYLDLKIDYNKKVKNYLKKNVFVVLDRSIIDTIVDLEMITGSHGNLKNYLSEFLTLLPKNHSIFFLDIPSTLSFERNGDEDHESLSLRRELYLKVCDILQIKKIDGTKSIDDIHMRIISEIDTI